MYSKRHLPDIEQWGQSSGANVIPRRARPGLAGLRPHRNPEGCREDGSVPPLPGAARRLWHAMPRGTLHPTPCTPVERRDLRRVA